MLYLFQLYDIVIQHFHHRFLNCGFQIPQVCGNALGASGGGASGCENEGPSSPIQLPGAPLFFCLVCETSKQDFIFLKGDNVEKIFGIHLSCPNLS